VRTVAVIPVKRLGRALGRLATSMSPAERRALQIAMLEDVLGACRAARRLDGTLVVTEDPEAATLAERLGARTISDHMPPRGMNAAVRIGLEAVGNEGAEAALVLVSDLPLADGPSIDMVVAAAPVPPGIVIAPSRDGTGTNALLLRPPGIVPPRLGTRSRERHIEEASRAGAAVTEVESPRLGLDVDIAADLGALARAPEPSHAGALCRRAGLADRAVAGCAP